MTPTGDLRSTILDISSPLDPEFGGEVLDAGLGLGPVALPPPGVPDLHTAARTYYDDFAFEARVFPEGSRDSQATLAVDPLALRLREEEADISPGFGSGRGERRHAIHLALPLVRWEDIEARIDPLLQDYLGAE
jgi:hypothetical protein